VCCPAEAAREVCCPAEAAREDAERENRCCIAKIGKSSIPISALESNICCAQKALHQISESKKLTSQLHTFISKSGRMCLNQFETVIFCCLWFTQCAFFHSDKVMKIQTHLIMSSTFSRFQFVVMSRTLILNITSKCT
jgi:hypothetical protein